VVERKNRSLEELTKTILNDSALPKCFWANAVSTACYVMNRVLIRPILKKTPYELLNGRKPNISHLKVFGCKCYILNNGKDNLGKFDAKSDKGIFLGYSLTSHAYRIFNKKFMTIEESIHVVFDETNKCEQGLAKINTDEDNQNIFLKNLDNNTKIQPVDFAKQQIENLQQDDLSKDWKIPRDLSVDNIIGQIHKGVSTRRSMTNFCNHTTFVSKLKSICEALKDEHWTTEMHEELNQFVRNNVWTLVPKSSQMNVTGTKWVLRNKSDGSGIITRNKARLVAKGYNQAEPIDYDETFTPVARLEAVRLLLAFSCMSGFKLFQMYVKSEFLNGFVNEEIYVSQPPGFEDHKHREYVYMLKKALYGLKQAPRQWYERLSHFLLSHDYERGKVDKTLFIKKSNFDIILVQIYVNDIIFGSSNAKLCEDFVKAMQGEFEMSMMGELSFFLGLQVKQSKEGIFVCQSKYCKDILKKFEMEACKAATTPMSTNCHLGADEAGPEVDQTMYRGLRGSLLYLIASKPNIMFVVCLCARFQSCPKESHLKVLKRILKYLKCTISMGLWYPSHSPIHLVGYSYYDFAGCKLDRKSTSGTCHLLGSSIISWHNKNQACVALSTAEAEYIAARSCCAQIVWIKQQLEDFGLKINKVPLLCDITSVINLTKNQVQHLRTKHIEIRHHFIHDHINNGDCEIKFVSTES